MADSNATSDTRATEKVRAAGGWARALDLLHELDPVWAESYSRMAIDPWTQGTLPPKDIQLIAVALAAAVTNMDGSALRRHIRAALHAGATRAEILETFKMAALLALHSMSLGAPILVEEAKAAGKIGDSRAHATASTPVCDRMKELGQWNQAWDPFLQLDPVWMEAFVAAGAGIYTSGTLTPKLIELISIALDAAITHMYAPGTRRHIKAALALGATVEEIMTVLKLCVSQGANAVDHAVPILAEEVAAFQS